MAQTIETTDLKHQFVLEYCNFILHTLDENADIIKNIEEFKNVKRHELLKIKENCDTYIDNHKDTIKKLYTLGKVFWDKRKKRKAYFILFLSYIVKDLSYSLVSRRKEEKVHSAEIFTRQIILYYDITKKNI